VLEHTLQGTLQQVAPRHRADVVGLDFLHGVDEQTIELQHFILRLGALGRLPAEETDRSNHRQGKVIPSRHRRIPSTYARTRIPSGSNRQDPTDPAGRPMRNRGASVSTYVKV